MNVPTTIWQAAPRIRCGDLRPVDLLDACLKRIEDFDSTIRAWVLVDEAAARSAATRLGDEVGRGEYRGPLHGIPIGIKDIVDVRGMPTRAGSSLTASTLATHDAVCVHRLRGAGAIILGKTVTTEFACFDPAATRNPWNRAHTPGGSSSGSAAAVASRMCLAAVGSQTGGSIIRPASYCGIPGLKATDGCVETRGVVPVSQHLDHVGPLARSVADLVFMHEGMSGTEGFRDAFARQLRQTSAPRLGRIDQLFKESSQPVAQVTRAALERISGAGASIQSVQLPESFTAVAVMHRRIMAVEAAEHHASYLSSYRDRMGPMLAALLDEGGQITSAAYRLALEHQRRFRDEMVAMWEDSDAMIMPSTPSTAPASLDTTGDPSFNAPWTYAGLPTVSIVAGLAADGMPSGLQLVGPAGSEVSLLAIAAWCERQLAFNAAPELTNHE